MVNKRSRDVSARRRKMQGKKVPWTYIIPAIILIGIIGSLIVYNTLNGSRTVGTALITVPANTPSSLPDVPFFCDQPTGCQYHWHDMLYVFVGNASKILIPADVGHVGVTNLFAIHAHDTSGIIHLECCNPSKNQTFTLGQLFEVWGYPVFDSSHCLNYTNVPVKVYVNGTLWTRSGIGSLPLTDHIVIAVVIGPGQPSSIPSYHDFSGL